jgi:phosphohistidine phosphatase
MQRDGAPGAIISSPAARAVETAVLVAEACEYEGEIVLEPELYGGYTDDYLEVLRRVDDDADRVLVVGHNPGLEELWLDLTGQPRRLPTAALGEVRLELDRWCDLGASTPGHAVGLWAPEEMATPAG